MHYIKAREFIRTVELEQEVELIVNNGDAVTEVINSLRQDGQQCSVIAEDVLTSKIKVKRKK